MALAPAWSHSQGAPAAGAGQAELIERGRYMVVTGHCNNCHTQGYAAAAGAMPESQWLMGNTVGWRGAQGTVFAPNLRLYLQSMDLKTWLNVARNARPRAPMPWWSLAETSEPDLTAIYVYIRSLRPLGSPAPEFMPAGEVPKPPYNQMPELSFNR